MIYQDLKIHIHYRKLDEATRLSKAARTHLRSIGFAEEEYFGVQIVESRRGEMAMPEIIPYTRERKQTLERHLLKLEEQRKMMSLEEVATLGKHLADILFHGTVRDMLVRCLDYADDRNEGLRLRLVLKDAETACLPWEYVYFQRVAGEVATWSGFLALNPHVSIVRHEPMQITSRSSKTAQGPLKIYVGFAEPEGVGQDLDEESIQTNIEEALRDEIAAGRIVLTINDQIQVKHLHDVAGYGIFNFSGHGAFLTEEELAYYRNKYRADDEAQPETEAEAEPEEPAYALAHRATLRAGFARRQQKHASTTTQTEITDAPETGQASDSEQQTNPEDGVLRQADRATLRAGFARRQQKRARTTTQTEDEEDTSQGILVFEKDQRQAHLYPATNLAQRLKRAGVRVVVMDSCYSAKSANKYKWTGMASSMVRVGIPAVLGMQFAFSDPAAREFWGAFYKAIASGLSLDEAISYGRLAIIDLEPEPSEENPDVMLTGQNDFGFPALYMRYEDGVLFPELQTAGNAASYDNAASNTQQENPHELALLKYLASQSQGRDFSFLYFSNKD